MNRSTAIRLSVLSLALTPLTTACTASFNLGEVTGGDTTPIATPTAATSTAAPAPTTDTKQDAPVAAAETTTSTAPEPTPEPTRDTQAPDTTQGTTQDTTSDNTPDTPAPAPDTTTETPATAAQDTQRSGKRQKIQAPAGSGISNLELIDMYGAETSTGTHGRTVGIYSITNDRPVTFKLRIRLFDSSGRAVVDDKAYSEVRTVGTHNVVMRDIMKLPAGVKVKSFDVSLIDVRDASTDRAIVNEFPKPTLGRYSKVDDVPALKGTVTFSGPLRSGFEVQGACILPDGKVIHDSRYVDTTTVRPGTDGKSTVDYEVALHDAQGMDLSKATCYAGA